MIFRRKLRYILVESSDSARMNDQRNVDELKSQVAGFLGQLPYFKANPQIAAQLDENAFVISVNRGYERDVVLALSFIKELGGRRIGFYTLRTSGTIRRVKDAFRSVR